MNIQCLSVDKGGFRLKKMMLTISPYLQSMCNLDHIIFTDDGDNYIKTLTSTYGNIVNGEIVSSYFIPTDDVKQRYEELKSLEFNYLDAINNLGEYSVFIYYGYIDSGVKSTVLSTLYDKYAKQSEDYLNTMIRDIVKGIRKEFLNVSINFKGKPVKPDDTTLSRISFIVTSSEDKSKTLPFRFEDGSFGTISITEVINMQTLLMNYVQRVMLTEDKLVKELVSLPIEEKHELLVNGSSTIKTKFDNIVKDMTW